MYISILVLDHVYPCRVFIESYTPLAFLKIFEQDAHAFTRRLNGILVPGPVCYVAKIDAFVVGNSEMGVDCYKYQVNAWVM